MLFSKSFDYALRGILYVSVMSDAKKRVQVEEISEKLSVPKHFLGKIMNKVVKNGILNSTKGPFGGLAVNSETLSTTLSSLLKAVEGAHSFNSCVLKQKNCDPDRPCVLHDRVSNLRNSIYEIMNQTTIGDILKENTSEILKKISVHI